MCLCSNKGKSELQEERINGRSREVIVLYSCEIVSGMLFSVLGSKLQGKQEPSLEENHQGG